MAASQASCSSYSAPDHQRQAVSFRSHNFTTFRVWMFRHRPMELKARAFEVRDFCPFLW